MKMFQWLHRRTLSSMLEEELQNDLKDFYSAVRAKEDWRARQRVLAKRVQRLRAQIIVEKMNEGKLPTVEASAIRQLRKP